MTGQFTPDAALVPLMTPELRSAYGVEHLSGDEGTFEPDANMRTCEWCEGQFLPEDMDGEHCRSCAADLFESGQQ